jgi:hypothetical protein
VFYLEILLSGRQVKNSDDAGRQKYLLDYFGRLT